jgi:hypothetical protein
MGHFLAVAAEGWLARDERVDERARLVDVGARVGDAVRELLGRHEFRRAHVRHEIRQAEVGDRDVLLAVDEDVGGLEVAVKEALGVRGLQRLEDLARDLPDLAQVVPLAGLEDRGERLALGHLGDDADRLLVLEHIDEGDDRRVAHARERGFAKRGEAFRRELGRRNDLHRDDPVAVAAAVDGADGALADQRPDLVGPDALGGVLAHAVTSSSASVASSVGGSIGSVTVILVPSPGVERTSMRPPCCVTILYAIESPSPVPLPGSFVV